MKDPEIKTGTEEENEGISKPNKSFEEVDRGIKKMALIRSCSHF